MTGPTLPRRPHRLARDDRVGRGRRLVDSPLPASSVSDELRDYPEDLLASALDVRSATLGSTPGAARAPATRGVAVRPAATRLALDGHRGPAVPGSGRRSALTPARRAAGRTARPPARRRPRGAARPRQDHPRRLPGRRRGRPRDAVAVAGTVTLTHTGGVLVLGLLLTAGTALAGEAILGLARSGQRCACARRGHGHARRQSCADGVRGATIMDTTTTVTDILTGTTPTPSPTTLTPTYHGAHTHNPRRPHAWPGCTRQSRTHSHSGPHAYP